MVFGRFPCRFDHGAIMRKRADDPRWWIVGIRVQAGARRRLRRCVGLGYGEATKLQSFVVLDARIGEASWPRRRG